MYISSCTFILNNALEGGTKNVDLLVVGEAFPQQRPL